jgi:hypothetical protein
MTNPTKSIAKLAVAIAVLGGVALSAATPSLAQTSTAYTVTHRAPAVDNPPGSNFQTQGNNDSMGCPC